MSKMLLSDVREFIKTLGIGNYFYIGKLDNKKEKSIGIYDRTSSTRETIPVGGRDNKKIYTKSVSVLIHWNDNANETEIAGNELYEKLDGYKGKIGSHQVDYIRFETDGVVDVGRDSNGIYERVIWLDIIYRI